MVGTKGKSGRHKKDCACAGCVERKAKRLMTPASIVEIEKKVETEGCY